MLTPDFSSLHLFFFLTDMAMDVVLAVLNVLTAQIFSNSRNFETEGDTPEKHGIKSLDP